VHLGILLEDRCTGGCVWGLLLNSKLSCQRFSVVARPNSMPSAIETLSCSTFWPFCILVCMVQCDKPAWCYCSMALDLRFLWSGIAIMSLLCLCMVCGWKVDQLNPAYAHGHSQAPTPLPPSLPLSIRHKYTYTYTSCGDEVLRLTHTHTRQRQAHRQER